MATGRLSGKSSGGSKSSRGGGGKSKGRGVVEANEANFASEVLEAEELSIVAFTAPWCGE